MAKKQTASEKRFQSKKIGFLLLLVVLAVVVVSSTSTENKLAKKPSVTSTVCNTFKEYTVTEALKTPSDVCILRFGPEDSVDQLPTLKNKLPNLQTIYFNKTDPSHLPAAIGDFSSLTALNLHHTVGTILPPEISKLKNLTVLHMSKTDIATLPPEIGKLQNLMQLTVRLNARSVTLPPEIAQLANLQVLTLWGNPGLTLSDTLDQNKSLAYLDLTNNALTQIPSSAYRARGLRTLNASFNQITVVAPEIANLTQLQALRLDNNKLTSLPPLDKLQQLETLTLNNNQLTALPKGLTSLKKLKYLTISGNAISQKEKDSLKQLLPDTQIVE